MLQSWMQAFSKAAWIVKKTTILFFTCSLFPFFTIAFEIELV